MSAGRSGIITRVALILGVIVLAGVVGWLIWGRVKPQPDIELIGKYINGYKDGKLTEVRSTVSSEMLGSLPGSATVFASQAKQVNSSIKSWHVKSVERNEYVGQSIVDIVLVTASGAHNMEFDIMQLPEGLRIRSVVDLADPNRTGANGSTGATQPAGMSGMGMPAVPGHY
jgi:hypothetical protein